MNVSITAGVFSLFLMIRLTSVTPCPDNFSTIRSSDMRSRLGAEITHRLVFSLGCNTTVTWVPSANSVSCSSFLTWAWFLDRNTYFVPLSSIVQRSIGPAHPSTLSPIINGSSGKLFPSLPMRRSVVTPPNSSIRLGKCLIDTSLEPPPLEEAIRLANQLQYGREFCRTDQTYTAINW